MKPEEITIDWLQARVIERDGCLVWNLSCAGGTNNPQANIGGTMVKVRRLIWELSRGKKIPSKVEIRSECEHDKCVHPDHLVASKRGAALKGKEKTMLQRIKIANSMRKRSAYKEELIEQIRSEYTTHAEASRKTGISESHVRGIRNNLYRCDYSNPFAGLGK